MHDRTTPAPAPQMPLGDGAAGRRVRFYLNETDRDGGKALYLALLERLRAEGCAGASAFRGIAGFGSHHVIQTAAIVDVVPPVPVIVEWVDTPERVERVLPLVAPLVSEGLITVEDLRVLHSIHRAPERLPERLPVGAIMTERPAAVTTTTPLTEVVQLVLDQDYRAVPVVDADRRVCGIITNSDLVERGGLQARVELLGALPPEALADALSHLHAQGHQAAEVMTPDPVTVRPETPVHDAAALMVTRRLKRLPVVDAAGRLLGMVSRADVLRAAGAAFPPAPAPDVPPGAAAPQTPLRAVVNPAAPVVNRDAPLSDVLDAVVSTRLNRAVVVDAGRRPVGIISDAALLARLEPGQRPPILTALMARLPFLQLPPDQQAAVRRAAARRAADLMTTDFAVAQAETSVAEAVRMMIARRQKILPVVDGEGRLIGAVDRADLLRAVDTWLREQQGQP